MQWVRSCQIKSNWAKMHLRSNMHELHSGIPQGSQCYVKQVIGPNRWAPKTDELRKSYVFLRQTARSNTVLGIFSYNEPQKEDWFIGIHICARNSMLGCPNAMCLTTNPKWMCKHSNKANFLTYAIFTQNNPPHTRADQTKNYPNKKNPRPKPLPGKC